MAPWCLFWCPSLPSKQNWAFPRSPNIFLHVSQEPLFKNIYNTKYIDTSACNVPLVPLVSFDIISKTFNPQPLGAPLLPKKKVFMLNLVPLVFLTCFFTLMLNYLLSFGCSLLKFLYFCCSPSFIILGVVQVCFLLLRKLRSSPNQNVPMSHQFKYLLRMFGIENVCIGQQPILGCAFETLA